MPDWSFVTAILTTSSEICARAGTIHSASSAAPSPIIRMMSLPFVFWLDNAVLAQRRDLVVRQAELGQHLGRVRAQAGRRALVRQRCAVVADRADDLGH